MLASITPLGEQARRRRWGVTVPFYIAASIAGGTALGSFAGGLGQVVVLAAHPSAAATLALAAALSAAALAIDARIVGHGVPSVRRQVNENWLVRYRGWAYGVGFGAQLGFGVVTIVSTASVYLLVGLSFLAASAVGGAIAGGVFGLVRALPVLLAARATTFARLGELHRSVGSWERRANRAAIGTEAIVALAAVAALVGGASWS